MGKLQDNQYSSFTKSKKSPRCNVEQDRSLLQQQFCPPLDSALIEAIFADTFDYNQSFIILKELAREAETALDEELAQTTTHLADFELDDEFSHHQDPTGLNNNDGLVDSASTSTTDTTTPTSNSNQSSSSSDTDSITYDNQDQRDDVNFLCLCFPTGDREQLLNVLRSQDNDVEKATDVLLNNVYLESDDYANSADTPGDDDDDLKLFHGTKKPKRRNRRHQHNTNQGKKQLLWSSRHIEPTSNDDDENDLTTIPFNYWHQYDDTVGKVHQVFPTLSRSTVHGCVQRCKGNIIAAVVMLMTPQTQPVLVWQLATNLDQVEQGMASILVDRTPDQIRRIAVGVVIAYQNDHDVPQMVQRGIEFSLTYEKQQQQMEKRLAAMMHNTTARATRPSGSGDLPVVPEYLLINNENSYTDDDPDLCRMMAMDLIFSRNELFQKAATAYRSGKNRKTGEQGVAFYYSDEARQLDAKAREWNMRAARAYVRDKRLATKNDHLLDLHGLTVNEAQTLVREGLTQWWSRSQIQIARRKIQPLQIITGAGNHSERGHARLLPSIQKLLRNEGWLFDVSRPGCFLVKGVVAKSTT
ncbi:hypothetical protein BC941DRAFT_433592 [Chlamydoabsidia padenii]|nr:hypothetical protein BC941DRAFT_433592 [Chlamydoabsidia padenii]